MHCAGYQHIEDSSNTSSTDVLTSHIPPRTNQKMINSCFEPCWHAAVLNLMHGLPEHCLVGALPPPLPPPGPDPLGTAGVGACPHRQAWGEPLAPSWPLLLPQTPASNYCSDAFVYRLQSCSHTVALESAKSGSVGLQTLVLYQFKSGVEGTHVP